MSLKPTSPTIESLSGRARKLLAASGISTVEQLCSRSWIEVHRLPGCGYKTAAEFDELLKQNGLSYRVDRPEDAFGSIHAKLVAQHEQDGDFQALGARYGIGADLMYQIYSGIERVVKARDKGICAHDRWRNQFEEDKT